MNRALILMLVLFLAAGALACGGDTSEESPADRASGDDDTPPPVTGDDDDDNDDDTTPGDDDDDDDDTTPGDDDDDDDDDNDDDDDDDNDDDDNDDDDSTPGDPPMAEIISPEDGLTYVGVDVDVNIAISNVDTWMVTLNGSDISAQLVATATSITGTLTDLTKGKGLYTLLVRVDNANGWATDNAGFIYDPGDPPTVSIVGPVEGETYVVPEVDVSIDITEVETWSVTLNDVDVSDQLTATADSIFGSLVGLTAVAYTLHVEVANDTGAAADEVSFNMSDGAYLDLELTHATAQLGTEVTRTVTVYDEEGNDITGSVSITHEVDPATGWTQDGDVFTFTATGDFVFTASCEYGGKELLADSETHHAFDAVPTSINLAVSSHDIPAGSTIIANALALNQFGDPLPDLQILFVVTPGTGVTQNGSQFTFITTGSFELKAEALGYPAVFATETIEVRPGFPQDLDLDIEPPIFFNAGTTKNYTVSGQDIYGNEITEGWNVTVYPMDGVTLDQEAQTILFMRAGNFTVRATYLTVYDQQTVLVTDFVPPVVEFTSPDRGTFTQGSQILLAGNVYDIGGEVAVFTINDFFIDPSSGQFYIYFPVSPGLNIFEAYVEDDSGHSAYYALSVLIGDYLPNDTWVIDAVGAMVTENGLDAVEVIAEDFLENEYDLEQLILDTLVLDETLDLGFMVCEVSLAPDSVNIDPIDLNIDAKSGYIDTTVWINNLYVGVTAEIVCTTDDGQEVTYTGSLSADWIKAQTPIYLGVDGDHNLVVTIGAITISKQNLQLAISGIDPLLSTALLNALWPMIETYANQIIQDEIPALIEEILGDLELAFSFELLDHTLSFEAQFSDLEVEEEGVELWLDAQTTADSYDPDTPPHPGSFYEITMTPPLGSHTPGGSPYHLGAVLSGNMLNQMLYIVYRSGMLSFTLDQETAPLFGFTWDMTAGDLELFFPGISDIAGADAEVVIDLNPLLPPIVDMNPLGKDVQVELQMGEFFLDLAVVPEAGDPVPALSMVIAVIAPLDVQTNAGGDALKFVIGVPTIKLDVIESMFLLPDALLETFLPGVVALVLPIISAFLDEFPIPTFEGYSLSITELTAVGLNDAYLGLYGDLVVVPAR